MSHISERLAEFIFEELSATEMAEARQHVSECADCHEQVERFQHTLTMLNAAPEVEPPRNIVFEFEKPAASRFWRWFPAATAVAALVVMTMALAGGVQVQWHDSQLTIAFGRPAAPAQTPDQATEVAAEIQRIKGHLAYLENRQDTAERNTFVIATKIEPIARAQRSPAGD